MRSFISIIIVLMLILPDHSWGSDNSEPSDQLLRLGGYCATLVRTQISELPLSYESFPLEGLIRSSGRGLGIATGFSKPGILIPAHYPISDYLGLDLELSSAEFSDGRVSNRRLLFYSLILEYGIIPVRKLPLVLYFSFGGGGIHQSDYNADWLAGGDLEYLNENEYPTILGYGIRFSILKNVILKYDIKSGYKEWEEIGDPVPGRPGWYYVAGKDYELIFRQVSLGLTYIWNLRE